MDAGDDAADDTTTVFVIREKKSKKKRKFKYSIAFRFWKVYGGGNLNFVYMSVWTLLWLLGSYAALSQILLLWFN